MTEIRYDVADGVALITLDAPERRNALSVEMSRELIDAARTGGVRRRGGCRRRHWRRPLLRGRGPQRPGRHGPRPGRGRGLPQPRDGLCGVHDHRLHRRARRWRPCAAPPSGPVSTWPWPPTCASSRARPGCSAASPNRHPPRRRALHADRPGRRAGGRGRPRALRRRGRRGARRRAGTRLGGIRRRRRAGSRARGRRPRREGPALARRMVASLRRETAPGGMPWDVAVELERSPQMWSLRRKHGS